MNVTCREWTYNMHNIHDEIFAKPVAASRLAAASFFSIQSCDFFFFHVGAHETCQKKKLVLIVS